MLDFDPTLNRGNSIDWTLPTHIDWCNNMFDKLQTHILSFLPSFPSFQALVGE